MSGRNRIHLREPETAETPAVRTAAPAQEASGGSALREADMRRPAELSPAAVGQLQRAAGNAATASLLTDEFDPIPGAGEPLDASLSSRMGRSFGADFSDVRVHNGPDARAAASSLQARAYTVGNDIVKGEGPVDERTMAHELAHVVQQREGPVSGKPAGKMKVSEPGDHFEQAAEVAASRATGDVGIQRAGFFDSIMGAIPGLFGGGAGAATGAMGQMAGMAGGALGGLGGMATGGLGQLADVAGGGLGQLGGMAGGVLSGVENSLPGFLGVGSGLATGAAGQMAGMAGGALGQLGGMAGGALSGVTGAASNGLGQLGGMAGGALGQLGSMASGGVSDLENAAGSGLGQLGGMASGGVSSLMGSLGGLFG
jgi:hypothetical protein